MELEVKNIPAILEVFPSSSTAFHLECRSATSAYVK